MANCILIGNSGGGSSDVNIISQAEWDAMSLAEKQASGITIVGEEGGMTGKWYNYTNAGEEIEYLPYSEIANIMTFANKNNFIADSLSWGTGINPVILQDYKTFDENTDSILIDVETSGKCGYVDLGSTNKSTTIYAVMKISSSETSNYARHLSCMATKSSNQGIILYGKDTVKYSSWGSDTNTSVVATDFYAIGISYNGTTAYCNINGNVFTKTPTALGQYLTIGRTSHNGENSGTNEEPSDMYVKFIGIVEGAESEDVIASNVQNLMLKYGIS